MFYLELPSKIFFFQINALQFLVFLTNNQDSVKNQTPSGKVMQTTADLLEALIFPQS